MREFYLRWKAKRELRKSIALIERLANELPTSSLRCMFPGQDPVFIRNELGLMARKMRTL